MLTFSLKQFSHIALSNTSSLRCLTALQPQNMTTSAPGDIHQTLETSLRTIYLDVYSISESNQINNMDHNSFQVLQHQDILVESKTGN